MSGDSLPARSAPLADLCHRWRIGELAAFGSAARGEDAPGSDIDLLVRFEPGECWSLLDVARLLIELCRDAQDIAGAPPKHWGAHDDRDPREAHSERMGCNRRTRRCTW